LGVINFLAAHLKKKEKKSWARNILNKKKKLGPKNGSFFMEIVILWKLLGNSAPTVYWYEKKMLILLREICLRITLVRWV
jgi:hypothetical protein